VFSWSYQHLPPPAARVFRLLGLQPAHDSGVNEIAALADIDLAGARRIVDVLLRAHLITEPSHGRYAMHDLLKAYAAERLAVEEESHDRQAATTRLFDHYRDSAATAARCCYPASQHRYVVVEPSQSVPRFDAAEDAIGWLDAQSSNLVAVAAHAAHNGWAVHASDLSDILVRHFILNGPFDEAVALHQHAADATVDIDPARHARALRNAGRAWLQLHEYAEAERCLQQALVCFRTANDRVGQGSALASLGHVRVWTCRYQEGIDLASRALDLLTPADNWPGYYIALDTLAAAYLKTGRPGDAAELWQRAHEMSLTRQDRERVVRAIHNLGVAYQHLDRYDDALRCLLSGLESIRRTGVRRSEGNSHRHLGVVYRLTGRLVEAEQHMREGLQIGRDSGDGRAEAEGLNGLGDICHDAGRFDEAITHHTAALPVASACGDRDQYAHAHDGLGRTYLATGNPDTAREHWTQALAIYEQIGAPEAERVRSSLAELAGPRP
jgi:tetratricopeptide (TPR) repeat protein